MKRKAAKTILMITGVLMLALSVLPHHHHGNAICFASTEYCSQCKDLSASSNGHDHGEQAEGCNVRQLFVMSCRNDQTLQQDQHPSFFPDSFFIQPYALPTHVERQYVSGFTTIAYPPFAEPLGSRHGGTSFSLRAPPVFIA